MKRHLLHFGLLCALALPLAAAPVPPPEKLLPADTLFVLTIPDYAKSSAVWKQWPGVQFWGDSSMKPFRDKFVKKLETEVIAPLEKELGIKFADYLGLAQGQISLAIIAPQKEEDVSFLLLIDSRDKSDVLKTNLTALKKKWTDSGKQTRIEKIRDVEFSTLGFDADDLGKTFDKIFPDPNANESLDPPKPKKSQKDSAQLLLGQSGSLAILGSKVRDIERVLAAQSGGTIATLSENAAFAKSHTAHLRESQGYGWLHLKPILEKLIKLAGKGSGGEDAGPGAFPPMDKIFSALGLTGLQDLSFSMRDIPEGCAVNFNLNVPESARKGLIKAFAFEARDANPPPFVPSDAVKFFRWRLDMGKSWNTIEQSLVEAVPQMAGVLKLFLDSAGKDKDPDFDIRKQLFDNLGDDVISYQKNPRKQTLEELQNPPSLTLISSPRPEQLAASIKALAALMPTGGVKIKEREFLGRKVYSMALPQPGGGKGRERTLSYAASGGYVAISTDTPTLEEFMRSGEGSGKSLRETPGLADAAQKIGGMGTGLFGYENSAETFKSLWESLKKDSGTLANLFSELPMAGRFGGDDASKFKDWVDFSLLPSFNQVSKYFYITVWSGNVNSDGFNFKVFAPNPPGMKK
jgi:hypothetical protein